MGNICRKQKNTQSRIRRIYVGDVPELQDENEAETEAEKEKLRARLSAQSLADEDGAPVEPPMIPVRRHSVVEEKVDTKGGVLPRLSIHHHTPKNSFPGNEVTSSRYTFWSFLPKNLYEQFRRVVNFYFLVVAVIQTVTDSPISPVTAIAPLAFVVVVTMIKQGYEDWLRHKADNLFNNRPVKVVRDGVITLIRSKDVKVGDIVKLEGEEQVPTDIVLLGSSDEFQRCLLNTANLDGETSLRMRYVPAGLPHFRDEADFIHLNLIVECEEPCEDLYRFDGNMLIPPGLPKHNSSLGELLETLKNKKHSGEHGITKTDTPKRHNSGGTSHPHNRDSSGSGKVIIPEFSEKGRKLKKVGVSEFNMIFLSMDNVILRGTKVKNTDFVFGVVVYTGPDTRLARNGKPPTTKFSTVERTVNKYLFFFITILLILTISALILATQVNWLGAESVWYLNDEEKKRDFNFYVHIFFSFLILFNYIIPISLYVTMEMQKFIGSKFFVWDRDMWTSREEPPLCNTSDLNEELGQIEYLFSDKTGTLTENVMITRMFSVSGHIFELADGKIHKRDKDDQSKTTEIEVSKNQDLRDFCRVISLCHSVQIMPKRRPSVESSGGGLDLFKNKKKKKISTKVKTANSLFVIDGQSKSGMSFDVLGENFEYQGSSPDEKALVESCVQLGVSYDGEKEDYLTLNVCGKEEKYKRHMMLEFDADRKCMSVIVENEGGDIYIMTKGAETAIIPRCDTGLIQEVNKDVLTFAMMGYRTLVMAQRKISRNRLENYLAQLKAARRLVENRDEVMKQIYRDIESHLHILGATGVEDKLQDGVVETLGALGAAGIRVWMLTGDKVETGTAVAYSCGLMSSLSHPIMITKFTEENKQELEKRLEEIDQETSSDENNVLVIDGESLAIALKDYHSLLCSVAMKAFRVICCRMTPLQKSQVVKMVKDTPQKPLCAAIGDGANDVAMIQEAHIGLGIIGKEGRQAARCADFAIAKFGFLKKAILVHGHWYYVRLANLANYFFYKNIIFVVPQILYCFSSAFSTQPIFDPTFLMLYNIFYTACPILFYGLMEQPYSAQELLDNPFLYRENRKNHLMTWPVFLKWMLFGIWHAFVCYFFAFYSWSAFFPVNDLHSFGSVISTSVVVVANMKLAIETRHVSWVVVISHCCSYAAYFVFTAVYSEWGLIILEPGEFKHVFLTVHALPILWLLLLLSTFTSVIPDILGKAIEGSWSSVVKFLKSVPKLHARVFPSRKKIDDLKKAHEESKLRLNVDAEAPGAPESNQNQPGIEPQSSLPPTPAVSTSKGLHPDPSSTTNKQK